jgi:hypothetical protein
MIDNPQMSVAMQRLVDSISIVTNSTLQTSGIAALAHAIVAPTLPPDTTLPTTSDLVPPTLRRPSTTLLPALQYQHAKQPAQQTSTAAPNITTATGHLSITDKTSEANAGS